MSNPVTLGKVQLRSNVLVAPMSGVTDLPFRRCLQTFLPGLVVSEMVAGEGLSKEDPENLARAAGHADLDPLAIQLVGRDPYWMAEGAKRLAGAGAQIIDINMGCPARKVVHGLSGSALMREPDLALEIIGAVVDAVDVPVTLKTRLGWDHDSLNAPQICKRAEELGVQMFVIHGRTRCQFYKGEADWSAVRDTVDAVSAPVFVNGDILTPAHALAAMDASGARGVMVGRGMIGQPWAIGPIMAAVDATAPPALPTPAQKVAIACAHYDDVIDFYPAGKGVRVARKHLAGYCDAAGLAGQDTLRQTMCRSTDPAEVRALLGRAFVQEAAA